MGLKRKLLLVSVSSLLGIGLFSCSNSTEPNPNQDKANQGKGTLILVANGEDFVRQGFMTKDGWKINFDRVNINLSNVKAYQTEPPYDPESGEEIKAEEEVVLLSEEKTVDLAEGDEQASPIVVEETEAPGGMYNALSWQVIPGKDQPAIVLEGEAIKDQKTLKFSIGFEEELNYNCGEFVGDERRGILKDGEKAQVETTFHFDHLFGDGNAPQDDEINTHAVGFEPFAKLAKNDTIEVSSANLKNDFEPATYEKLEEAILGLGHVGEGHCELIAKNE